MPDPAKPYPIPPPTRFVSESATAIAYVEAPDLVGLSDELRGSYDELADTELADVGFLWKGRGGRSKGTLKLGAATKPSGLLAHYCHHQFVIWLAADHMRGFKHLERGSGEMTVGATWGDVSALLYHELRHVGFDEDEQPLIQPHDVETFAGEMLNFGAWWGDLRAFAGQLKLELP